MSSSCDANVRTLCHSQSKHSNFETFQKYNLEYNQKRITNLQLSGLTNFTDSNSKIEWSLSPSFARVFDKDVRSTQFVIRDNQYSIFVNLLPTRIWRDLVEDNGVAKVDYTKIFKFKGVDSKLKLGLYGLYKTRDFSIFKIVCVTCKILMVMISVITKMVIVKLKK